MEGTSVTLALLSGAAGALIATILQQVLTFWAERVKLRGETALTAIGWADDVVLRLVDLTMQKTAVYGGGKPYLAPDEYNANTRDIRNLLLQGSIPARIAIAFGYGEEVRLVNALRSELLKAARMLWGANLETWPEVEPKVQRIFSERIETLRRQLEQRLLRSGSVSLMLNPSSKSDDPSVRWTLP